MVWSNLDLCGHLCSQCPSVLVETVPSVLSSLVAAYTLTCTHTSYSQPGIWELGRHGNSHALASPHQVYTYRTQFKHRVLKPHNLFLIIMLNSLLSLFSGHIFLVFQVTLPWQTPSGPLEETVAKNLQISTPRWVCNKSQTLEMYCKHDLEDSILHACT